MPAFNITGVARIEMVTPATDLSNLGIEATALFNGLNMARERMGAPGQLEATVCQGHKVLLRLSWSPARGTRVVGRLSQ